MDGRDGVTVGSPRGPSTVGPCRHSATIWLCKWMARIRGCESPAVGQMYRRIGWPEMVRRHGLWRRQSVSSEGSK